MWILLLSLAAHAQEGFNAHGYEAAGQPDNPLGYLELFYPDAGWSGSWDAGVVFDYADDPLIEDTPTGPKPVLDQVLGANLVGGASILGYARVEAAFPVYPYALDQVGTFAGLGDLRLDANIPFLKVQDRRPGISVVPTVWFPTGTNLRYLGDPGMTFGATLAVAEELGPVGLAVNLGGRVGRQESVRNVSWGPGFTAGLGLGYRVTDAMSAAVEARVGPSYKANDGSLQLPAESLVHLRTRLPLGLYVVAGAGTAVHQGIGAGRFRVVAGLGWSEKGVEPEKDKDGDGLLDKSDRCATEAEDMDGYRDNDGCPDLDNDLDHVPDTTDRCPNEPEDADDILDEDGCPELDADQDAVPDGSDRCPLEAEDQDGNADQDGCPEGETDADSDGVPDHRDACPDQPIRAGQNPRTSDGCPRLAEISENKIVITDVIYFEEGKAKILPESTAVLEAVAQVLRDHLEVTDLLIEGHTNDVGAEDYNYKLSDARAKAVMEWLVVAGIDRNRLAAKGYGETRPIVPNDTEEGRAVNRRVEFTILTRVK